MQCCEILTFLAGHAMLPSFENLAYFQELAGQILGQILNFQDLKGEILNFQDLEGQILNFQYLAVQIVNFQELEG